MSKVIAPQYGVSTYRRSDGTVAWFHSFKLALEYKQLMQERWSELDWILIDLETGQVINLDGTREQL